MSTFAKTPLGRPFKLPSSPGNDTDEKSQLFEESPNTASDIDVKQLQYQHVGKAAESVMAAFQDDPVQLYARAGNNRDLRRINEVTLAARYAVGIRARDEILLTVNDGEATVVATKSKSESGGPSFVDNILRQLLRFYERIWNGMLFVKEQKKRIKEIESKFTSLVKNNLGVSIDDMVHINLLGTSPMSQGKGYGSALVAAVTSMADAQNRSSYLISSNIGNTAFYKSCGFTIVAHTTLGDDNPSWKASPIVVPLMVRKSQSTKETGIEFEFHKIEVINLAVSEYEFV